MTVKELIEMLRKLSPEEQEYPVGYWGHPLSSIRFIEYNDIQIEYTKLNKKPFNCIVLVREKDTE